MIRFWHAFFFAGAAMAPLCAASAQEGGSAAPNCAAQGALPPGLAGWAGTRASVQAAGKAAQTKAAHLTPGVAADSVLLPTPSVKYAVPPIKPGGSVSHGGLFAFDVSETGVYRFALNSHAWTDVINGQDIVRSVAHGHGPACTAISKMVDYALQPGQYILQISGNGDATLTLLLAKLP